MIWLDDFNQHHLLWDEECNSHLFTANNLDATQILLDLLRDHNMTMTLPKDALLLLVRQVHICGHQDDQAGAKELGAHKGKYMLVI